MASDWVFVVVVVAVVLQKGGAQDKAEAQRRVLSVALPAAATTFVFSEPEFFSEVAPIAGKTRRFPVLLGRLQLL